MPGLHEVSFDFDIGELLAGARKSDGFKVSGPATMALGQDIPKIDRILGFW
jgi:hypothetical protein